MKIGSIVIDCNEFDKMLAFWQEALHYVPREPAKDGWVVLRDPTGRNPNVSLNQDPKKRLGRNRLLKIGATRHPQTYEPDDDFLVLEDPDGNLFCVVQKDTGESRVSRT